MTSLQRIFKDLPSKIGRKKAIFFCISAGIFIFYLLFLSQVSTIYSQGRAPLFINTSIFLVLGLWLFLEVFLYLLFFHDNIDGTVEWKIPAARVDRIRGLSFWIKIAGLVLSFLSLSIPPDENLFLSIWSELNPLLYVRIGIQFACLFLFGWEFLHLFFRNLLS